MTGLHFDTCQGDLIIGGNSGDVPMVGPGWCTTNLTRIRRFALRGDYQDVPPDAGTLPDGLVIETTELSLPLTIGGETNQAGVVYPEPWAGLDLNLAYLFDNLLVPPGTETGTRLATHTTASGAVLTATLQVLDIRYGDPVSDPTRGPVVVGSIELLITSGRFA